MFTDPNNSKFSNMFITCLLLYFKYISTYVVLPANVLNMNIAGPSYTPVHLLPSERQQSKFFLKFSIKLFAQMSLSIGLYIAISV